MSKSLTHPGIQSKALSPADQGDGSPVTLATAHQDLSLALPVGWGHHHLQKQQGGHVDS
jgi:hypothetical protein